MPFSSLNFLFLVPILLLVYWGLPEGLKRIWLCVSSIIVYVYAGVPDLLLLLVVTFANWASHRVFPRSRAVRIGMIIFDIAILGWFKYRFFIADSFGIHHGPSSLIIPLGISFYIFQLISYQVEIQKGILKEEPTFFAFFLYIFFFPHHQAGPIMRPHSFLGSFRHGRPWNTLRFKNGLLLVAWGLLKKIWIADFLMSGLVDSHYAALEHAKGLQGNMLLLGCLYGVQIYADFSGYSDIAVGLGKLFGFKLDRNFHQPYIAKGPSEFWRRWHVTLSVWLRDHIYIPLGGNRHGAWRTQTNLVIVMLVGGLWHGANWTFILWGGLHGFYLVLEKIQKTLGVRSSVWTGMVYQCLFMLSWVPFREQNFGYIWQLAKLPQAWLSTDTLLALLLLLAIVLFSLLEDRFERAFLRISLFAHRFSLPAFCTLYALCVYLILCGVKNETTFIYQRF